MKQEFYITLAACAFFLIIVIALFNHDYVISAYQDSLHEIKTADAFKQVAFTPPVNNGQGYYPNQQGYVPNQPAYNPNQQGYYPPNQPGYYPNQQPGYYPNPQGFAPNQGPLQQVAMPTAPPIAPGQDIPVLIKIMGVEAIQVGGGKVKITGVMGNSWAEKAKLQAGDILLTFNAQEITGLDQFQGLLKKAPPEQDAKITYMRETRKKKTVIFIGEGEMEGFLPIKR